MRPLLIFLLAFIGGVAGPPPASAAETYRIISLVPSSTEMLFALGAGHLLVGVDNFSNYPATAAALPKLGDYRGVSLEAIAALRPTHLALLDDYFPDEISERLRRLGIKQITCRNQNVEDVKQCALLLGKTIGREAPAKAIANRIERSRLAASQAAKQSRPKQVLIIVETQPLYAIGPNNFLHELFSDAGFINVLAGSATSYPMISFETVLASKPDIVVTFRHEYAADIAELYRRSGLRNIPAIVELNEEIFTRSGPRVAEAYLELARLIATPKP